MPLKKLYVGCGNERLSDFVHSDISELKNKNGAPDFLCDIAESIPMQSESVNFVYTKGTLDMLNYVQIRNALINMNRILATKGFLRIVVFDFDKAIKSYLSKEVRESGDYGRDFAHLPVFCHNTSLVSRLYYPGRRYLLNYQILEKLLKEAGFDNIKLYSPGETGFPDNKNLSTQLEHTEKQKSSDSMIVECTKSSSKPEYTYAKLGLPEGKINRILAQYFNLTVSPYKITDPVFPKKGWFLKNLLGVKKKQLPKKRA
ncbi:MAG: hypothetical protein HON43_07010 [Alphaproteobacteria bacterium]|jgi:predicted SAM-dependent methyltransferase|nr:hypothetical protein [Alphaproteobacteria bacterium]MBT5389780.1 hypothetical protein [Alphaproteobacteria bacterium]MBT5540800.1 hypothetical protein [Alphaproteobacteria bacterium]